MPDAVAQRLRELVADENVDVRSRVIEALASVAAEDPATLPLLVQAMRDRDESVGQAAVAAWLSITPSLQERGVPQLAELLRADDATRRRVAYVLGRIGPKAAVAVSAFIDAYSQSADGDSPYADALSRIGTEAMSPLSQAVKDGRLSAEQVAGIFANMPMDTREQLLSNLGHAEAEMREIAARSVGRLMPAPSEATDRLAELLDDQVPQVRAAAAAALGNLGTATLGVEKSLAEAAADTDGAVRAAALAALGKIGSQSEDFKDSLVRALSDSSPEVRRHAAEALSAFESVPEVAVESLAQLLQVRFGCDRSRCGSGGVGRRRRK